MTIRQSNGEAFLLKSPNKLSKNSGKFWNHDDIKYINFSKYGDLILIEPIKIIEPTIPKEEENIEYNIHKEEENTQYNIKPNIYKEESYLEDNYLEDFDKEIKAENNDFYQNEITKTNEEEIEGGSPVVYQYIDSFGNLNENKVYAQILEQENNSRVFIISKNDIVHENNIIKCEWESCKWRIKSIIRGSNNFKKIITTKE